MTSTWNTAAWLARRQMRDTWTAYGATALYFAFTGAALASDDAIILEIGHVFLMMILIQPVLSPRYMTWKTDNEVIRHQRFLRSLPLPLLDIVRARMIGMVAAGAINAPLYFMWFWFTGDRFDAIPAFLTWCLFWISIALVGMTLSIVQEFWLNLRAWSVVNLAILGVLAAVLIGGVAIADWRPVEGSVRFANSDPLVLAAVAAVIAVVSWYAAQSAAVRTFRRREFVL